MIALDDRQWAIRKLLVEVVAGKVAFRQPNSISYKELWAKFWDEPWHQFRTQTIIDQITRISAFEAEHGRPPLNEIVIPIGGDVPRHPWDNIHAYIKEQFGVDMPYCSHEEAIAACRAYWAGHELAPVALVVSQAEEGFLQDRTVKFRVRNKALIVARKRLDNYTCQACGFRLKIGGNFIIDCHHKTPLGTPDAVRVTHMEDLICLCPTCHRIAHTRAYPLEPREIVAARENESDRSIR